MAGQAGFNFETLGSLDIFEIYTAKSRRDRPDYVYEPGRVSLVDLDVAGIDTGKDFK